MKKKWNGLLAAVLAISLLPYQASAAVEMPLRVVVDGKELYFPDAKPYVDENNRTQIPVRFIGEALGAEVKWDREKRQAIFEKAPTRVVLTIGKAEYEINGRVYRMDTKALLQEERTFVPARYVAEALGAKVEWDSKVRTVYITSNGKPPEAEPEPEPAGGTVKYYDGIAFNPVTDTDEYGRVNVEKAKEFTLNMAKYLKFVKEDGKYVINVTYPEIPEGYVWTLIVRVHLKNKPTEGYTPFTRIMENRIPQEGSFTKVVPISRASEVEGINIAISIDVIDRSKLSGKDPELGYLNIVDPIGETERKAVFVPRTAWTPSERYPDFPFDEMFQWE